MAGSPSNAPELAFEQWHNAAELCLVEAQGDTARRRIAFVNLPQRAGTNHEPPPPACHVADSASTGRWTSPTTSPPDTPLQHLAGPRFPHPVVGMRHLGCVPCCWARDWPPVLIPHPHPAVLPRRGAQRRVGRRLRRRKGQRDSDTEANPTFDEPGWRCGSPVGCAADEPRLVSKTTGRIQVGWLGHQSSC